MKLIRGQTLEGLLRARRAPSDDLPRFLGMFEQVCQAVAYAHSEEVIHRDLKPSNVMVGAFGEVQVMDWNFAKEIGLTSAEGAAAAGQETLGPAAATLVDPGAGTAGGQVIGTPAYMPPEQARGEAAGRRSDVFGLGAMLCEVLTGQPPFGGNNRQEALARARACDHAEALARLDGGGADAELVRLCKVCLSAEPTGRPADAGEVAQAVAAYQAQVQKRLRAAELEKASAQAREDEARATAAAEKRARRRTVWLAIAVLVFVFLGGGWGLSWTWQRAQLVGMVNADSEEFARHLRDWQIREAEAALERAEGRVAGGGPGDLLRRVQEMRDNLSLVHQLNRIRLKAITVTEGHFDYSAADREYGVVFRERMLAVEGEDPASLAARIQGSAIKAQLVAALDCWAIATTDRARQAWLLEVARRAEPGEWSNRFRDPAVWKDQATLQQLAREANVAELSPQLLTALGVALTRTKANPLPLLMAARNRYPTDYWLNLALGNALCHALQGVSGRRDEAMTASHAATAADALVMAMSQTTDPQAAAQISLTLQAVSGRLDASVAGKAADALVAAITTTTDLQALQSLSKGLQVASERLDASMVGKVADALVTAMSKTTHPQAVLSLSQALQAVSGRLDASGARKVADALVAAMTKTTDPPPALGSLSQGLQVVSGRLDASGASKAADALVAAMTKTSDRNALLSLSQALQAVSRRLDDASAASCAGKAADALVAAMTKTSDRNALLSLFHGLQAVSGRLDASGASKAADALVAAMSKTTDPYALGSLSQGLRVVSGRLDDASAASCAGKAADALVAAMSKTTDPNALNWLSQGLQAVSGRLDASGASKGADALQAVLSKTTDPNARNWLSQALRAVRGRLDTSKRR
jgi:hypothetical protein